MKQIVIISIHGLIRGENMELGRDSDTGGQVTCQNIILNNTYFSTEYSIKETNQQND
jgi:hypothetical protein